MIRHFSNLFVKHWQQSLGWKMSQNCCYKNMAENSNVYWQHGFIVKDVGAELKIIRQELHYQNFNCVHILQGYKLLIPLINMLKKKKTQWDLIYAWYIFISFSSDMELMVWVKVGIKFQPASICMTSLRILEIAKELSKFKFPFILSYLKWVQGQPWLVQKSDAV